MANAWRDVRRTKFEERARILAARIASARPHLVGLQEVELFRIQTPGDAVFGGTSQATTVVLDYLALLQLELDRLGARYRVAAVSENVDLEAPMFAWPFFSDIRVTDRDVILAREDVGLGAVRQDLFVHNATVRVGGTEPVVIHRGWVSVVATWRGTTFRFVTTHLEPAGEFSGIQEAQAQELQLELDGEPLPVVLVGDLNSTPDGNTTNSYALFTEAGFEDAWTVAMPTEPGSTCCQDMNLRNQSSRHDRRIDVILTRDLEAFDVIEARVLGSSSTDRTTSGLWPSDHAGVTATFSTRGNRISTRSRAGMMGPEVVGTREHPVGVTGHRVSSAWTFTGRAL